MGIAVAGFLGSTSEWLPAATFFPALALFALGAVQFLIANREAMVEAEAATRSRIQPAIGEDRAALARAERQAARQGAALSQINAVPAKPRPPSARPPVASPPAKAGARSRPHDPAAGLAEIELLEEAEDEAFQVTQDVSFPLEVQRGDALADQLLKLNRLLTQGVLTEQEYAAAKSKLLS